MPYPLKAPVTTIWPCKTREQSQGAVTALTGCSRDMGEWLAVEAHERKLLELAATGVLLHHAGGWFKFRDDAATFTAGIWNVFHKVIPSCATLSAPGWQA
jgi:hypothetical protein